MEINSISISSSYLVLYEDHTKRKGRSVLNGKRVFRHPKTNSFAAAVCRVEKRNCYSFSPSLLPPNCCFSKPFKLFCIRSRVVRSLKTSVRCVFVLCCMAPRTTGWSKTRGVTPGVMPGTSRCRGTTTTCAGSRTTPATPSLRITTFSYSN